MYLSLVMEMRWEMEGAWQPRLAAMQHTGNRMRMQAKHENSVKVVERNVKE